MNMLRAMCALPLTVTGLLFSCGPNQGLAVKGTPEPRIGVTNAQKGTDTAAANQLAEARCEHEKRCKNIGLGAKYVSLIVCMDRLRRSIARDLDGYKCPGGLDSDGVDGCMAALGSEECNHPFDTLTRYEQCRTGAACIK